MNTIQSKSLLVALMLVPASVLSVHRLCDHRKISLQGCSLPSHFGQWSGEPERMTEAESTILSNPEYLESSYVDSAGDSIDVLVIAADSSQEFHDPALCMQGAGYQLVSSNLVNSQYLLSQAKGAFNKAEYRFQNQDYLMLDWYQDRFGVSSVNPLQLRWRTFLQSISGKYSGGLFIRLFVHTRSDLLEEQKHVLIRTFWKEFSNMAIGISSSDVMMK